MLQQLSQRQRQQVVLHQDAALQQVVAVVLVVVRTTPDIMQHAHSLAQRDQQHRHRAVVPAATHIAAAVAAAGQ